MSKSVATVGLVSAIVVLFSIAPFVALAEDVSGSLEINKKKFTLSHGYLDMAKPEEPVIILSDKPLPPDQIPYIAFDYAVKNNVHAVVFTVVRKDKKLTSHGRAVYFGGDANTFGVFPDDKVSLHLKEADDTLVQGKFKTLQPVEDGNLTYSFDASFNLSAKVALEKARLKRKP